MNYLKNHVFSRKSGLRHLAALLLTVFVLVWTYVFAVQVGGDESWLYDLYWECYDLFNYYGGTYVKFEKLFWGIVGIMIGLSALMGGLVRRCGESWIVRFFQKFFYSVIGAIPIVNLLVPLIYQRVRKKQGKGEFVPDGSFRDSLKAETYRALVTDNTVLEANGKLKFGIIRFVFVATFRLIGGVFLLFFALLIPLLTPLPVMLGVELAWLVGAEYMDWVCWAGMAAVALTVMIDVIHPILALLINPRRAVPAVAKPEPACDPEPVYAPDPEPEETSEPEDDEGPDEAPEDDTPGVEFADPVEESDPEPEPVPDPAPAADPEPETQEDTRAWAGVWDEDYAVAENGHGRDILNHKEIIL